jgi:hypothetical protein
MGERNNRQCDTSGAIVLQLGTPCFGATANGQACHHDVGHLARGRLVIPLTLALAHAIHLIRKAVRRDEMSIKRAHANDVIGQMRFHQSERRLHILRHI